MKRITLLLTIFLCMTVVTAEQITIDLYLPDDSSIQTDHIYAFTQPIKLVGVNESTATLRVAEDTYKLNKNERKVIGNISYTVTSISPKDVEILDKFYLATKVKLVVENFGATLPTNQHILTKDDSVNLEGNDFELDELFFDQITTARIQYTDYFGTVEAGKNIVFYKIPLAIHDITYARGAIAEQELMAMHFTSDKELVDLSYFPSMYINTEIPLRIVLPNEASDVLQAAGQQLVNHFEEQNELLDIEKVSDTFLASHVNYQLILLGDSCQNQLTKYYAQLGSPCDREPSIELLKKGNKHVTALMARTDEEYIGIISNMFITPLEGTSFTFTDMTGGELPVIEEPVEFEITEIEPVVEEPIEEFIQEEPILEDVEPLVIEDLPEPEESKPAKIKGDSTFKKNCKKVWDTILWFFY